MSTSAPPTHPIRRVARVAIQFTTPFHVGTGGGGAGTDALAVTDANGLPAIPGSSLAGALRAAFLALSGDAERTERLFGFQKEDRGCGSALSLSWAAIHGQDDQPVEGLVPRSRCENDPVLFQALGRRVRDHVRLTQRGAAAHRGKFDEQPVAAGHRLTFGIELVDQQDETNWQTLLGCLASPALRLGGKSRRGYGAFEVVRLHARSFDLRKPGEFAEYAALGDKSPSAPLPAVGTSHVPTSTSNLTITLRLQPCGFWMFGGGEDLPPKDAEPADMAPLREQRISWQDNAGRVEDPVLLLPGSAIKGALAHRVAFHCNRLGRRFAEEVAAGCTNDKTGHEVAEKQFRDLTGIHSPAIRELFGFVEEGDAADGEVEAERTQAVRGQVLIDDVFWIEAPPLQQRVPHVSIDRFTGGAADARLFSERPLWKGVFPPLRITILNPHRLTRTTRQSLSAALDDLANGRLALGAGAGRGLGYFEPVPGDSQPIECSAGTNWFDQEPPDQTAPAHAQA